MQPIYNKKALQSYEILETFEAGMVLYGFEVAAIRRGSVSLRGSYVIIRGSEVFLKGATVTPLQQKNAPKWYDPLRDRKLLLSKKEIQTLIGKTEQKGLTLIPTKLYSLRKNLKVEVALVRNKSTRDKRQDIKRRDDERDMARTLKQYR